MGKGKLGVNVTFYAALAFLLVLFRAGILPLILLLGITLAVEQNEWATRQVIQAMFILFFDYLVDVVLALFNITAFLNYGTAYKVLNYVDLGINRCVLVVVILLSILGLANVCKGKDAGIPVGTKFANWAYGKAAAATVSYQQAPYQQQAAPQAPAAPAGVCKNCGTPLNGSAFCPKCGTPAK